MISENLSNTTERYIMGVCRVVEHLAGQLSAHVTNDPKLKAALVEIGGIVKHLGNRDLSAWEQDAGNSLNYKPDEWYDIAQEDRIVQDPHYYLAEEIYELGRHNLYGAYDVQSTKEEYKRIVGEFERLGVHGAMDVDEADLRGW